MQKSTRYVIIGIGIISILSGIYSYFTEGELFAVLSAFFIGASLIWSVFFDQKGKQQ